MMGGIGNIPRYCSVRNIAVDVDNDKRLHGNIIRSQLRTFFSMNRKCKFESDGHFIADKIPRYSHPLSVCVLTAKCD